MDAPCEKIWNLSAGTFLVLGWTATGLAVCGAPGSFHVACCRRSRQWSSVSEWCCGRDSWRGDSRARSRGGPHPPLVGDGLAGLLARLAGVAQTGRAGRLRRCGSPAYVDHHPGRPGLALSEATGPEPIHPTANQSLKTTHKTLSLPAPDLLSPTERKIFRGTDPSLSLPLQPRRCLVLPAPCTASTACTTPSKVETSRCLPTTYNPQPEPPSHTPADMTAEAPSGSLATPGGISDPGLIKYAGFAPFSARCLWTFRSGADMCPTRNPGSSTNSRTSSPPLASTTPSICPK